MIFDASSIYSLVWDGRFDLLAGGYTLNLAFYEIGNALWKDVVIHGRLTLEEALEIMGLVAETLGIMVVIPPGEAGDILRMAVKYRLSFYDAAYLEAAVRLNRPLITEDGKLARKASKIIETHTARELARGTHGGASLKP